MYVLYLHFYKAILSQCLREYSLQYIHILLIFVVKKKYLIHVSTDGDTFFFIAAIKIHLVISNLHNIYTIGA